MSPQDPVIFQFSLGGNLCVQNAEQAAFKKTTEKLNMKALVLEARNKEEALRLMDDNPTPYAILITDGGITLRENQNLSRKVIDYARNGGKVVLSVFFASRTTFHNFDLYMQDWGLPWKLATAIKINCMINIQAIGCPGSIWERGMPALHDSKTMLLLGVRPNNCWYLPVRCYVHHRNEWIFKDIRLGDGIDGTPMAFTNVGKGFLGFTGNVEHSEATDAAIFSMLAINHKEW
ncbi:hypothetical protein F5Y06DRAFT_303211 [Hypoxylon sp. FL0890]|nr:hypothetical protein F5Y06DRAFT_303211 [Hypoxylon sp. FL0890]